MLHKLPNQELIEKVPSTPKFLNHYKVDVVFGLMNVYPNITIQDPLPDSVFMVSSLDSHAFHGSLYDHPGCSKPIDINISLKTSIAQIFLGNQNKKIEFSEMILSHRKKMKIDNFNQLSSLVSEFGGELDDSVLDRLKF